MCKAQGEGDPEDAERASEIPTAGLCSLLLQGWEKAWAAIKAARELQASQQREAEWRQQQQEEKERAEFDELVQAHAERMLQMFPTRDHSILVRLL